MFCLCCMRLCACGWLHTILLSKDILRACTAVLEEASVVCELVMSASM